MSDPRDGWGTEWEFTPTSSLEVHSLCRAAGYWLRTSLNPDTGGFDILRATDLTGSWTTVLEAGAETLSIVSAANDVAMCWFIDGPDYYLRWSDDAFSTYTDLALPSGWKPPNTGFARLTRDVLRWDGTRWGVFLVNESTGFAVAHTTDFASLTVNSSSVAPDGANGSVLNGDAESGWCFTTITGDAISGFETSIVYGDDFAATWYSHTAFTESGDYAIARRAYRNGSQAAFIKEYGGVAGGTEARVWTASAPNGTYTEATTAIPEGFVPQVWLTQGGFISNGVKWDSSNGVWVILGSDLAAGLTIATTADLSQPWDFVEIDPPGDPLIFNNPTCLDVYEGDWFAATEDESGGNSLSAVLKPGILGGEGWGLLL